MVVKASKRKSFNTSGVWEVEAVPESPNQAQKKKVKLDTPTKSENGETKNSSISPSLLKTQNLSPNKGNMQRHFENKSQSIGQSPHIKGNKQQQEHQRKQNQERPPKQNQKQQPKQNQKQQPKQNQEQQHEQNQEQQHMQEHEQLEQQQPNQSQSNQQQESKDSLNTANLEEERKWTASDLKKLVSRLEEQCKHLFSRPHSEAVEEVDWTKISFDGHSAEVCKSKWLTQFEKTRSIRHLVEEAREMLMNKPLVKGFPKPFPQNTSQQSDTLNSFTAPKDLSGEGDEEEEEDVEMKGDDDTSKKIEDKNEEEGDDDDDEEEEEEEKEEDSDDDDDDQEDEEEEDDDNE